MKVYKRTLLVIVASITAACSNNNNSTTPLDDGSNIMLTQEALDANNYRAQLESGLAQLRGEYFKPFIEVVGIADGYFPEPLPDATNYFGPDPYPTGVENHECDSGNVARDIASSDADRLTIQIFFNFSDCQIGGAVYSGRFCSYVHIQ